MIQRRHYLKRSTKPIRRVSKKRAKENREYTGRRAAYLQAHPFCQITIAYHGLNEALVINNGGFSQCVQVPKATQIHHRNKCRGARKNDERWWMSASDHGHRLVEDDKAAARRDSLLLPFEADQDGRSPAGQALTTPDLLKHLEGHTPTP